MNNILNPVELPPALRDKVRFKSDEASAYLAVVHGVIISGRTLDKLRCVGGGPEFQKFGRQVLYLKEPLDTWAVERLGKLRRSTSDKTAA